MSWTFYLGLIVFFTLVFAVFYAVAYSVFLAIRENYFRYYQKAELQWTGTEQEPPRHRLRVNWLLGAALLTAWMVVHFIIQP